MDEYPVVVEVSSSSRASRVTSRLSRLRKKVQGGRRAQREEFECILDVARAIARQDPKALPALIKLIGRSIQARAVTEVLRHSQDSASDDYEPATALFNPSTPLTADGRRLYDFMREVPAPRSLELGVDLILPWPWNRGRIINSLCNLRPGGKWGKWRQDNNHLIELWLPVGVGWVAGGNHSLTVGILHAQGKVKPEITYDISKVYKHVTCDGVNYIRSHDGSTISPIPDLEMAAIFEIGRLMQKHRVGL